MYSLRILILIACLIMSIGDLAPIRRVFDTHQSSETSSASKSSPGAPVSSTKSQTPVFTTGNSGEIHMDYGARLGFTDYKAPNGSALRVLYWDFDDVAQANDVFNKEIARALKIVNCGKKKDATGKVVGERAQILVPSSRPGVPSTAILWTEGTTFREIRSHSLGAILELEKLYSDGQADLKN